jgi:3-oxoacyl-[acyl-carrier protein] reductase
MTSSPSPFDAYDLSEKVAVITGAASGIGQRSVEFLAAAGAAIVAADVDAGGLGDVVAAVNDAGGRAIAQPTDVTDRAAIEALVQRAVDEHGRLDVLANIAGAMTAGMIEDLSDDQLEQGLSLNLRSVIWGCQAAIPVMKRSGGGSIINISSGAIDLPKPAIGVYALTKAAVAMLTKTLAVELGPFDIRVNALAPGATITKFTTWRLYDDEGNLDQAAYDAFIEEMKAMSPLGMVGEAADQAHLILYLASDASRFTTGSILRANGGQTFAW